MERKRLNNLLKKFSSLDKAGKEEVVRYFSQAVEAPVEVVHFALRELSHMAKKAKDFRALPISKKKTSCVEVGSDYSISFRIRTGGGRKKSFRLTFSYNKEE